MTYIYTPAIEVQTLPDYQPRLIPPWEPKTMKFEGFTPPVYGL